MLYYIQEVRKTEIIRKISICKANNKTDAINRRVSLPKKAAEALQVEDGGFIIMEILDDKVILRRNKWKK